MQKKSFVWRDVLESFERFSFSIKNAYNFAHPKEFGVNID